MRKVLQQLGANRLKIGLREHRLPEDPFPNKSWITRSDFTGGFDVSNVREDIQEKSSPFALDMEVTKRNRLVRAPGTTLDEALTGHVVRQMALHTSLDYRSELILFAPPFLGIRSDAGVVWVDMSLPTTSQLFGYCNFGGTFIFSNGDDKVWARQPNIDEATLVEEAPVARAYASFAGRLIAGDTYIGGHREPLGVRWSAADSNYEHWDEQEWLGAGFELLIDEMSTFSDRIVAMRTMGLDFLAIICRRSIWLGKRTRLTLRPVDFQPRVPGVGAVNPETVKTSRFGVFFLSDNGVHIFDGNQAVHISKQIDPELLPLDINLIEQYSATYDPRTKRYYLFTPVGVVWIYDIEYQRWYKRGLTVQCGSVFADQTNALTWDELVGTWDDQIVTWDEFGGRETEDVSLYFVGHPVTEDELHIEDPASTTYFGVEQTPIWEFKLAQGENLAALFTTTHFNFQYTGSGEIQLWLPDNESVYQLAHLETLTTATDPTLRQMTLIHTGKGAGIRIQYGVGFLETLRLQIRVVAAGMRLG